jgi:hypothetical protein
MYQQVPAALKQRSSQQNIHNHQYMAAEISRGGDLAYDPEETIVPQSLEDVDIPTPQNLGISVKNTFIDYEADSSLRVARLAAGTFRSAQPQRTCETINNDIGSLGLLAFPEHDLGLPAASVSDNEQEPGAAEAQEGFLSHTLSPSMHVKNTFIEYQTEADEDIRAARLAKGKFFSVQPRSTRSLNRDLTEFDGNGHISLDLGHLAGLATEGDFLAPLGHDAVRASNDKVGGAPDKAESKQASQNKAPELDPRGLNLQPQKQQRNSRLQVSNFFSATPTLSRKHDTIEENMAYMDGQVLSGNNLDMARPGSRLTAHRFHSAQPKVTLGVDAASPAYILPSGTLL